MLNLAHVDPAHRKRLPVRTLAANQLGANPLNRRHLTPRPESIRRNRAWRALEPQLVNPIVQHLLAGEDPESRRSVSGHDLLEPMDIDLIQAHEHSPGSDRDAVL